MRNLTFERALSLAFSSLALGLIVGCNKTPESATKAAPIASAAAATVNGEPISLDDYNEHTGAKQTAQVMGPQGPTEIRVMGSFGLQSLQELVDQKVLLQMAKEEGVSPTESDVDTELAYQKSLNPNYETTLHDQGQTESMIRHELLVGLARQHIVMKGITVAPDEVEAYIKAHPEKFTGSAKATVLFVQVSSPEKRAAVDAALSGGRGFAEVAVQFSEAPNAKATGALYPSNLVSRMPKQFQDAVSKTAEKSASSWITLGKYSIKLYVNKKTPPKLMELNTPQKELVRRSLAIQRGQVKNDFDRKFLERLKAAKVDVTVPYLKDSWEKTWNQLSAPSGSPTPPAVR